MNPTLYKIILLGVPGLILAGGLTLGIWFIVKSSREEKKNKNSISGYLFFDPIHQAEEGCMGKIIDHEKKAEWPTPTGSPFWYRFKWYLPKTPFFFFQEKLVTPEAKTVPDVVKCSCGFSDPNPKVVHMHTIWNPHKKQDGKPITKEEYAKLHVKVIEEKPVTPVASGPLYKYDNYEPTDAPAAITPFDIFDLNNWDCQREFHKKRIGNWEKAINMGAGIVLACVCLFVSFIVISEVQKNNTNPTTPTQATTLEVTK